MSHELEFKGWQHSAVSSVQRSSTLARGKCLGAEMNARSVERTSMFAETVDIMIQNRTMNVGSRRPIEFRKRLAQIFATSLCLVPQVVECPNEINKRQPPKHCSRRSEEVWLEQITLKFSIAHRPSFITWSSTMKSTPSF